MSENSQQTIDVQTAGTLDGLFRERIKRSPEAIAYRSYERADKRWVDLTWREMGELVSRWQTALAGVGLEEGDRVALMLKNSPDWVAVDIATLSLGMADVPLYTDDRPDNIAYILRDSGSKVLVLQDVQQWKSLAPLKAELTGIRQFVIIDWDGESELPEADKRVVAACKWLPEKSAPLKDRTGDPHKLASIVYTSGTTGRSKGVMLSHYNMLSISAGSYERLKIYSGHLFLSFLPLSHTFERSCGYYAPMMNGSTIAYARSVQTLADDIQQLKPTVLISVPRIFERIYDRINDQLRRGSPVKRSLFKLAVNVGWKRFQIRQGRGRYGPSQLMWPILNKLVASKIQQRLGGRVQLAVSGGAALPFPIAKLFLGLGINLIQGYGMTECSPVVCANTGTHNDPQSVGMTLPGVEVRLGENDELEVNTPGRMIGYWNNDEATREVIAEDGWLRTGDKARISDNGFVHITGRIKDILVLSNGEKLPPGDMEQAIMLDPLFEQALIIGEARPYLSALIVINPEKWEDLAKSHNIDPADKSQLNNEKLKRSLLKKISECLRDFPGYAKIRRITLIPEPWSIENGLLTPTLKIKRALVINQCESAIESMYS